jgi:hypothetical protein
MILKKLHLQFIAAICFFPSFTVAGDAIGNIDCMAYWQLRSAGLEREHGIASAKRMNEYQEYYRIALQDLKQQLAPEIAAKQIFESMGALLEDIDYDYDRTAELDARYFPICIPTK